MKSIILIAALLIYISIASKAAGSDDILPNVSLNLKELNKNMTMLERWRNFEKNVKDRTNAALKMVLPFMMENFGGMNLSKECVRNAIHLISGLKNTKPWAMRFIDSSAKIIDGILVGTLSSFGVYDECVDTEVKSTRVRDKGKLLYRGQYCTIDLNFPLPPKSRFYKMDDVLDELKNFSHRDTAVAEIGRNAHYFYFLSLKMGICTPSGCSTEDVDKMAKILGNVLSLNASATRCEQKEENEFTPLVITVITCYSFAGFLMLVASMIDIYAYYRKTIFKNKLIRILLAFSFFTNFRKFTNTESSQHALSCLNGIRFLSMTWIIIGHTYITFNVQMILALGEARTFAKDFAFQAVVNGSVAVDTFFFIGGLLVCYLTIKLTRFQGHKFNIGLYIFHRLWRVIPVYAFVIMFMLLGNMLGSGPTWHDATYRYIKACYDNWWTNLLFINNFYDVDNMCMLHSWYIASDVQLYLGALLIILPMIRWPKMGILLSVLAIMASVVYSGVGTYINDYPPALLVTKSDPQQSADYFFHFYSQPFVHACSYYVGFLAGYLLATKPDLKIPPRFQMLGWSLAFISNFSVLYGAAGWNSGAEITFWSSMLYASLNRTAWSLGVAWMTVCCATGHGGVINHILSWKVLIPLGRLTYTAYLIHPLAQRVFVGNLKSLIQPDHFVGVWLFFGHLCVTYAIAFAGSMLIEAPFMALEKILLPSGEKKADNKTFVKGNNIPNESFKSAKNGIALIVPSVDEESGGIDNKYVIYKL